MKTSDLRILESQLRQEGHQQRAQTAFSPLLHERIMAALRTGGLTPEELRPEKSPWFWRAAVPVGIAAAVAVLTWLTMQPPPKSPPGGSLVKDFPPIPAPLPKLPVNPAPEPQDTITLAADTFDRGKYAYLDRDAEKLFHFVANQLPGLPAPRP